MYKCIEIRNWSFFIVVEREKIERESFENNVFIYIFYI